MQALLQLKFRRAYLVTSDYARHFRLRFLKPLSYKACFRRHQSPFPAAMRFSNSLSRVEQLTGLATVNLVQFLPNH